MRRLVAVDLFCGAGGFTEGFKQSGFDVAACLDNWRPAVDTHVKNHPATEIVQADILDFEPADLPACDVLIGSPPCTEFSYANRGGHGDLGLGMRFVLRYLRFVQELKPKYWIMENVPRLFQSLPSRVHLRRIGVAEDGHLEIPVRRILNSADFGVPQKRLRLISGRLPLPEQSHSWAEGLGTFSNLSPWVPVKSVLGLLPDPLSPPRRDRRVSDPCYELSIPEGQLTDHFMDTRLTPEEVEINRKSKTDHSWYGRMAFPDPVDRPARTVMATQTGISRETLVLEVKGGSRPTYRRPTIRECASFQSFPLTYQFWATTAQTRYKLVGNAVPPLMAAALARAIMRKEGRVSPATPILTTMVGEVPSPVSVEGRRQGLRGRHYPPTRRFRDHVPGSKAHGMRVDFANVTAPSGDEEDTSFDVRWESRLVSGSGKRVVIVSPALSDAVSVLATWAEGRSESGRLSMFLSALEEAFSDGVPDADGLQTAWAGLVARPQATPPGLLRSAAAIVDTHFPAGELADSAANIPQSFPDFGRRSLPVRLAAQLVAASYLAAAIANGTRAGELHELARAALRPVGMSKGKRPVSLVGI